MPNIHDSIIEPVPHQKALIWNCFDTKITPRNGYDYIGSQPKGGCGKSTTSVNICAELARANKDVVLLDADKQGTSARWASDRNAAEVSPVIHCVQKFGNIRETLLDLDKRYEFVVVDTAGRDSKEMRTGITAADVLLVPFRPSQPDLDTLAHFVEVFEEALDLMPNPSIKACAVLTMAPSNPVVNEANEAKEYR